MNLVDGIDENTVDFAATFDGTKDEPTVMPSRFPNLLVNGSQGIAVGMATNIPTHALGEVIDAATHLIDHPDATIEELMKLLPGPDFPTGCLIMGRHGILDAYRTGRGSVRMRAVAEIEEGPRGDQIVVFEELLHLIEVCGQLADGDENDVLVLGEVAIGSAHEPANGIFE